MKNIKYTPIYEYTNLLVNIYKHYSVLLKLPVLSEWPVAE